MTRWTRGHSPAFSAGSTSRRRRQPTRPWSEAVLTSEDGVPYLAPDLQLLFKGRRPRPKDTLDAREVLPKLSEQELGFLKDQLPEGHPWTVRAS